MPAARALIRRVTIAVVTACTLVTLAAAGPARADDPTGELAISVLSPVRGTVQQYFLTCGPDGGRHPDPVAACNRLREIGGDLDQLRFGPGVACPLIYDPRIVQISGVWNGEAKEFSHDYPNGCFADRVAGPVVPAQE